MQTPTTNADKGLKKLKTLGSFKDLVQLIQQHPEESGDEEFVKFWENYNGKFQSDDKLREIQVLAEKGLIKADVVQKLNKLAEFEKSKAASEASSKDPTPFKRLQRRASDAMKAAKSAIEKAGYGTSSSAQRKSEEAAMLKGVDLIPNQEKPVIEGYLHKRSGNGKYWKRRYVVCSAHVIRYYRVKRDHEPIGELWLNNKFFVADSSVRHLKNSMPHGFMISDFEETLFFAGASEAEKDYWMHSIAGVIRRLQAIGEEDSADVPQLLNRPVRNAEDLDRDFKARIDAYQQSLNSMLLPNEVKNTQASLSAATLSSSAAANTMSTKFQNPKASINGRIEGGGGGSIELSTIKQKIICEVMMEGVRRADEIIAEVDEATNNQSSQLSAEEKRSLQEMKKTALATREAASTILSSSSEALAQAEQVKMQMEQEAAEKAVASMQEKIASSKKDAAGKPLDKEATAELVAKTIADKNAQNRVEVARSMMIVAKALVEEEESYQRVQKLLEENGNVENEATRKAAEEVERARKEREAAQLEQQRLEQDAQMMKMLEHAAARTLKQVAPNNAHAKVKPMLPARKQVTPKQSPSQSSGVKTLHRTNTGASMTEQQGNGVMLTQDLQDEKTIIAEPMPPIFRQNEPDRYLPLIKLMAKIGTLTKTGTREITFGKLFDEFSKNPENGFLTPILVSAKRDRVLDFKGDMLFRNFHGDVVISLSQPVL